MSNNDDMEVFTDRGRGPRSTADNIEGQEARGNKGGSRGEDESEREQLQREQAGKIDHHSKQSMNINDANKGDWIPVGSNTRHSKRKDDMAQDGMSSYQVKTGVIEVRFTKIGDKGFNVVRSLKDFIAMARESDTECSIIPLNNEGDNICRVTNLPNTKDGIGMFYHHVLKFNNING
jgi:hypothetical protein